MLQLGYLCLWLLIILFCWNNVVVIEGVFVNTTFECGNIKNFRYPFWLNNPDTLSAVKQEETSCEYPGFGINCSTGNPILTLSNNPDTRLSVTSINFTEGSIIVIDLDFLGKSCPRVHRDYVFDPPFYSINRVVKYYSNCALYPPSSSVPYISCLGSTASKNRSYVFESDAVPNFNWDKNCEDRFQIPVLSTAPNISKDVSNYGSILQLGFILQWQTKFGCSSCEDSGGKCGISQSQGAFDSVNQVIYNLPTLRYRRRRRHPVLSLSFSICSLYPPSVPCISCLGSNASKRCYVFESDAVPNFNWDKYCKFRFQIPVLSTAPNISKDVSNYGSVLQLGFQMKWSTHFNCLSCQRSGGNCGPALFIRASTCYCPGVDPSVLLYFCNFQGPVVATGPVVAGSNDTRTEPVVAGSNHTSTEPVPGSSNHTRTEPVVAGSNHTRTEPVPGSSNHTRTEPVVAGRNHTRTKTIIIGVSGVAALVLIIPLVYILVYKRKMYSRCCQICKWNNQSRQNTNVEVFLEDYGRLAPYRYRYLELKRITNFFKDKLGQGGYGGVFKGKLKDGRLVAVKVLTESKGNGEEFVNEVATIGRTNHVNIVSLLGYCSQGLKRALVYEFMPNGSLEKFIYNEKSASTTHHLGWEKLYQIALGIANGLEYLHRGCNPRILHFDIKPHNILLDEDFCPKISDFGLAKLCPTRDSIVSMLGTRGTIGYIAPEVYCRNFGGVSSKSDVYSYGMMVLEMVGGRKNIDATVENISEIYFPQWIYNHLEQHGSTGLGGFREMFEEESTKKMIIVGLWCIQTHSADRPSMSTVVEMLQKSVEDLKMPPNPFQNRESSQSTS